MMRPLKCLALTLAGAAFFFYPSVWTSRAAAAPFFVGTSTDQHDYVESFQDGINTVTGQVDFFVNNGILDSDVDVFLFEPSSLNLQLTVNSISISYTFTFTDWTDFNGGAILFNSGYFVGSASFPSITQNGNYTLQFDPSLFPVTGNELIVEPGGGEPTAPDGSVVANFTATMDVSNLGPVVTPIPATLPLFATGIGAMGLFGWRRKRKNAALAA